MRLLTVSYIIGVSVGAWLMARLPIGILSVVVCVLLVAALMVKGRRVATVMLCFVAMSIGVLRTTQEVINETNEVFFQEDDVVSLYDNVLARAAEKRSVLLERLDDTQLTDEAKSMLATMVLGEKTAVKASVREIYSHSGASHVLAISGMHIGVIFALLMGMVKLLPKIMYRLVGRLKVKNSAMLRLMMRMPQLVTLERMAMPLVLMTIWGYALLVGMSSSVLRSAVMLTIAGVCLMVNRPTKLLDVLTLAGLCILLVSPLALFDVGFQMSFMAVLGIGVFYHPFQMRGIIGRLLMTVCNIMLLSLSAQVLVLPLTAFYFGDISLVGVLSSLVVAVTVIVILWLGVLMIVLVMAGMGSSMWSMLTDMVAMMQNAVVSIQNQLLGEMAHWSWSHIEVGNVSLAQLLLIYIIIGSGWLLKNIKYPKR